MLLIARIGVDMSLSCGRNRPPVQVLDEFSNEGGGNGGVDLEISDIVLQLLVHFVQQLEAFGPTLRLELKRPERYKLVGKGFHCSTQSCRLPLPERVLVIAFAAHVPSGRPQPKAFFQTEVAPVQS
jgi:hypothetical protein